MNIRNAVFCGFLLIGCGSGSEDGSGFEVGVNVAPLDIDNVASQQSAWSGKHAAQKSTLSRSPTTDDYVHGFSIAERSDDPCSFSALFNDIDDPTNLEGNELWNECNGSPGNYLAANMPNSYRTTGVAVCLNSAGDKMKGFALIGRYPECILDPDGTTPTGAACNGAGPRYDAVEERTNCPGSENGIDSDWEDEAECDPGYIVTGVELNHIASSGNRRMITGVRALCHPLLP